MIIDTGVDESHPDLIDAIDDARDFTRSRFGPVDQNGHGTHTSGTLAARQNNVGVIGVAPDCRLLVGKVLGDDGAGSAELVAAGIDWACDAGADVISMSLGSPQSDSVLMAAVTRAASKGKFLIAAAGNDGRADSVNYPARWRDTIAVAAVDRAGQLAPFSSRGPEVDVAAPGEDIVSTWLKGGYAKLSGTSMATPFVAGVVVLALSLQRLAENPATSLRTISELRDLLGRTSTDAGPAGRDDGFGWGLIDPDSLLVPASNPPPPINPNEFVLGGITVNGREGVLVFQPR